MTIIISKKKVIYTFLYVTLAVILFHILGLISRFALGYDHLMGLIPLFNMEMETNVPTAWSTFLLVVGAFLSLLVALLKIGGPSDKKYWYGLFAIFIFLSLDEFVSLHERLMLISRETFDSSGLLYYAWVIPMGAFFFVVAALYSRFVLSLDKITRGLIISSGVLFVSGAVGLELFEGLINEQGGYLNLKYMILVTIEETLEMVGVILFIYALLNHIEKLGSFEVTLQS